MQHFSRELRDDTGALITSTIAITITDGGTGVGPASTIYSDDGVTPLTNPFNVTDGIVSFWAQNGVYSVGSPSITDLLGITLHDPTWRGARVSLTGAESINDVSATAVPWDQADVDTDTVWAGGNPTRLTVPAGVTRVRLSANVAWASNSTGVRLVQFKKNGSIVSGMPSHRHDANTSSESGLVSSIITVVAGDYFEMEVYQSSTAALDLTASAVTWFDMEIVN